MPSDYNSEKRQISVETEFSCDPRLATAALLQSFIHDLLFQNGLADEVPGEFLDAAVVLCGLGGPRAQIELISDKGSYWDSTHWEFMPSEFLDHESLTYAHALATWCRSGNADSLPVELGSAKGSLKHLNKTDDSFFQQNKVENDDLEFDTLLDIAANGKESARIVAMKFFQPEHPHLEQQDAAILQNLQHRSNHVMAHAISAAKISQSSNPQVIEELRLLSDNHDPLLRSKAVQAITSLGQLDEFVADNAAKMLSSSTTYVAYSGLVALSQLDGVSEDVLKLADRGFERALHTCNYQFVQIFAATYKKWLSDPTDHLNKLWGQSSPEYLQMATEALASVTEAANQA